MNVPGDPEVKKSYEIVFFLSLNKTQKGMIADMKHESKVGLIDRDIGKIREPFFSVMA